MNFVFETDNVKLFNLVTEYMVDLYERKNADYGNSFHNMFKEDGIDVARIKLKDKMSRFDALSKGASPRVDESMEDTLIDLANYAIMTVMELTDWSKIVDNSGVCDDD